MQYSQDRRLTQLTTKGGCAAKVAAVELRKILSQVRFPPSPPELLIGTATFDDAALYQISPGAGPTTSALALVQTLDFFTPIVDSPKLFGRIAAANALSDVFAMGGRPITAMAIFGFPVATLHESVAVEILQGASDAIADAGAAFVGGHTIDDDTLKFGLSVTGLVDPRQAWSNAGCRAGDVLLLTKPLGTGTLTAALKQSHLSEPDIKDAIDSMCLLNNVAGLLPDDLKPAIHAATDVTGFGLAGHALNLARASQQSLIFDVKRLPQFSLASDCLSRGFLTKAHRTNLDYVAGDSSIEVSSETERQILVDPQTSGGLLMSVDPGCAERLLEVIATRFSSVAIVGRVETLRNRFLFFS